MFMNDFLLPVAGYRDSVFSSATVTDQGGLGIYWSSSPDSDFGNPMYFGPSGVWTNGGRYRADGLPLRCFKNTVDTVAPTCDTPDITITDGTNSYTIQACNL
jgi:hypothetical protein